MLSHALPLLPLLALLAGPATAQVKSFHGIAKRDCASVLLYSEAGSGFEPHGMMTLHWGAPQWKADYAQMVEQVEPGKRARLGKDGWTTLDTSVAFEAGGQKIAAGCYYLAIEAMDKGKFGLVLIDSQKARAENLLPFASESLEGGTVIPLDTGKANDKPVEKLEITLTPDEEDATKVTLALRWGPFHVSALLQVKIA